MKNSFLQTLANLFHRTADLIGAVFILPIRFYQKFISPLKGRGSCRFYPTCSEYAIQAIKEWGVIRGTGLALWRILRCNPFCAGGIDHVPKKPDKTKK